ncbi:hypothetical protein Lal_00029578 [Lupinus albus]|uniref:Putative transcription factor Nin-like family n=1 Tax=Lupinus albus TaxID=3870 RepID=A0A6A5MT35_LUPAL|nr:putative transcription factor Nin-like family [Lupinus albus]KAF1873872.1 hypothetical protein Lal_00029578 [Lupinus albus]
MDSTHTTFLTTLLVFKNTIREELIRSVHVYKVRGGKEREVEREFVFSESGSYGEMQASPILRLQKICVSQVSEGYQNGVWLCIFAFHTDQRPQLPSIPFLLLVSRNPKLKMIPTLLNDLRVIYELACKSEDRGIPSDSPGECQEKRNDCQPTKKTMPMLRQDLNCLPSDDGMSGTLDNKLDVETLPGIIEKKRRAPSDHIAKIALPDLVKYFDVPIVEASRNLNVGLTVLKRKCREFGIPRWPHRKIKSLDSLIHDLQEEAKQHEPECEVAASAVAERKRMLESEKENIERKPSMDIKSETKRFRQEIFKRKHRAKVLEKQTSTLSNT